MKNKQYKLILRAFLASKIPDALKNHSMDMIDIDSYIAGYCSRLLRGSKTVLVSMPLIPSEDRKKFDKLINMSEGEERIELIIYYRLAVLAELVILQYSI